MTENKAIQLRATSSYKDIYGVERKNGQEWLITLKQGETHILDVNEQLVKEVELTVLSSRQYCVVYNPIGENGKNKWGTKELRKGERSFFLMPGEELEKGIQNIPVLNMHQNLLVRAINFYKDP